MAVEVISPTPRKCHVTICSRCGYALRYTNEDVSNDGDGDYSIRCPRAACRNTIPVKSRYEEMKATWET